MKRHFPARFLALLLALVLLLPACGGGTTAATIHLKRTEGTVGVTDSGGKDITPREDLGLYSGYGMDTQPVSYAWINLDDVKLVKMDENSSISIEQDGKKLAVQVNQGSLFFNITQPLADDETLDIRTSSMAVGIRGTCGWVEVPDPTHMNVYLLEGTVTCNAADESMTLLPGAMAAMSDDGSIDIRGMDRREIPTFVMEEITSDPALLERLQTAVGWDFSAWNGSWDDGPDGGDAGNTPPNAVPGGESSYTYEYDARGRITRLNEFDAAGNLKVYHTFDYVDGWIEVEDYNPDGSLDGWMSYETPAEFYESFQDILPPDYTP